jgi:hypothetical protein
MTSDGLLRDGLATGGNLDAARALGLETALDSSTIIDVCDGLLGELGRREHRFGWLRAPDGAADSWLVVDAYYPMNRLVLRCRTSDARYDDVCAELIPSHGLKLLDVTPSELGADRDSAVGTLAGMINALGPRPQRAVRPVVPGPGPRSAHEGVITRAFATTPQRRVPAAPRVPAAAAPHVPARAAPHVPARAAPHVPARAAPLVPAPSGPPDSSPRATPPGCLSPAPRQGRRRRATRSPIHRRSRWGSDSCSERCS